jgi:hypothetical protein
MKKSCGVCGHAQRAEIDRALMAGDFQKTVAIRFGLSAFAISRHVRHSREPEAGSLSAKAELWASRAEQLWTSATFDADTRAQVAALTAGLKSLQAQQKEAERQIKQEPQKTAQKFDPPTIDEILAHADARQIQLCIEESQRLQMPDVYALFCSMVGRPAMQRAVIEFANEYVERQAELHDRT